MGKSKTQRSKKARLYEKQAKGVKLGKKHPSHKTAKEGRYRG